MIKKEIAWHKISEKIPSDGYKLTVLSEKMRGRNIFMCNFFNGKMISIEGSTFPGMPAPIFWAEIQSPIRKGAAY